MAIVQGAKKMEGGFKFRIFFGSKSLNIDWSLQTLAWRRDHLLSHILLSSVQGFTLGLQSLVVICWFCFLDLTECITYVCGVNLLLLLGKDSANDLKLSELSVKPGAKIMMMGTREEELAVVVEPPTASSDVVNDFDIEDDEVAIQDR